jgi:hypothetical protein
VHQVGDQPKIFKSSCIVSIKLPPDTRTRTCNQEFVLINEKAVVFYICSDDRLKFPERRVSRCISAACTPSCLQTNWIKELLSTIRYLFPATYKQWQRIECESCTGI